MQCDSSPHLPNRVVLSIVTSHLSRLFPRKISSPLVSAGLSRYLHRQWTVTAPCGKLGALETEVISSPLESLGLSHSFTPSLPYRVNADTEMISSSLESHRQCLIWAVIEMQSKPACHVTNSLLDISQKIQHYIPIAVVCMLYYI